MKIGKSLRGIGDGFRSTINKTVTASKETISRTKSKIEANSKRLEAEKQKQKEMDRAVRDYLRRKGREEEVEGKRVKKKAPMSMKGLLVDKPVEFMTQLAMAWVVKNAPKLIRELEIMTKKVRVFMATVKRVPGVVFGVIKATAKYAKVFVANLLNFDFKDRQKQIDAAKKEFDGSLEDAKVNFSELANVWGREEDELDTILRNLDDEKSIKDTLTDIDLESATPEFTPISPVAGAQPTASGAAGDYSPKVKALLDTISYAEGTPSYGTIYGGAVVPELAAGELTIAEVLEMQRTGKVRGRDVGYKRDGYDSDATGRYQFMSYVLKEEVEKQGVSMSEKFTPAMQDKLILGRIARMRGVTQDKIEKEGLSRDIIDRLAPEFASFPNLIGPDAKGVTGTNTSYYGQGGKSESALTSKYNQNLSSQSAAPARTTQEPMPAMTTNSQLVAKVPFSDFSKTARQGGTGAVGKTDGYLARGGSHKGIDIGTSGQKGWYCALKVNGKVTYNGAPDGLSRGAGWMVIIQSGDKEYVFMHLARKSKLGTGQSYSAGTIIGEIGNTGGSFGEHLHFEVRVNNQHIDPTPYLNLIEIGKLKKGTNVATGTNINGAPSAAKADRIGKLNSIASRQTGGTQTRTNVLTVTQKEIIMVG